MANKEIFCPSCHGNSLGPDGFKGDKRYFKCKDCGKKTANPLSDEAELHSKLDKKAAKKSNRFVVTSAQNDTKIHSDFFESLLKFCEEKNAQLLVIPVRYKNPDAYHLDIGEKLTWPSEVSPYLLDTDLKINDNLIVMGDIKITATAANPLSGLDSISGQKSAIFGHAQQQMKMVPTPQDKHPKMLHTTGSVSKKNYSRTKEGKKGEYNHDLAAVYIEADSEYFWFRELVADDTGEFYDLDKKYTPNGVVEDQRPEALVLGDEHVKFMDDRIKNKIFKDSDSIVQSLNPKAIVSHDVYDHYARSHHADGDYIGQIERMFHGDDSVEDELNEVAEYLDETTPEDSIRYIVESNHHDHLRQWLNRFKNNSDIKNAPFYHRMMAKVCDEIISNGNRLPFQIFIEDQCNKKMEFVGGSKELIIKNINCTEHGDVGPNGARGSPRAFANSSHKMIVGHTHSPCIEKDLVRTGVTSPELPYAKRGLSSWSITHALIYPNGKRTLITMVNKKWELDSH